MQKLWTRSWKRHADRNMDVRCVRCASHACILAACSHASYVYTCGPSLESWELSGWLRLGLIYFIVCPAPTSFTSFSRSSLCSSLSVLHLFRPFEWEHSARSGGRLREMTRSRSETDADCGRDRQWMMHTHAHI